MQQQLGEFYLDILVGGNTVNKFADLTARLSWINWENLGVNPGRRSALTTLALSSENLSH